MKPISFLDVGYTYRVLRAELDEAYLRVMESGQYIGGLEVAAFERNFADFCGTSAAVAVANGLDALTLALRARGIGQGHEVIVPAHTFIATWLAVTSVGATVVPVDADPVTMNIDANKIPEAISARTKAIIPVHLYGATADMNRIMEIANQFGIFVIEDAAQAHGSMLNGTMTGNLGHVGAFSLYPGKNLGAFGDGGILVSSDVQLIEKARAIANYGSTKKYFHDYFGVNSRLDPLQAAFLGVKLNKLRDWNIHRASIAEIYLDRLRSIPSLQMPCIPDDSVSSWHLFVLRHPKRDEVMARLAANDIPVAMHYPVANHRSGAYRTLFDWNAYPVATAIADTCISLPIGPHLELDQAVQVAERVADVVESVNRGRS